MSSHRILLFKLLPRTFFVLILSANVLVNISLEASGQTTDAQVVVGKGAGTITSENGVYALKANVTEMQDYAENNRMSAAVFDYRLPNPAALPEGSDRISFQMNVNAGKASGAEAKFRVLIRDSRGGEWAVGTRLGFSISSISPTNGFEVRETYGWKASELGRIDPWIMMSLDPKKFDEYNPPQAPLSVVGFRLIVTKGTAYQLSVRDIQSMKVGVPPDPYWWIAPDATYASRCSYNGTNFTSYGWAPQYPQPYLKAGDLKLASGNYDYNWELLTTDEAALVRSGSGKIHVESSADPLKLPLLPPGAYLLRVFTREENEKDGKDALFQYVVVRNAKAEVAADSSVPEKPLRCSFGHQNVLRNGASVIAVIHSQLPGSIRWTVQSSDRKSLLSGTSDIVANGQLKIDLTNLAKQQPMLWLTASLFKDNTELDRVRRMVGYKTDEGPRSAALGGPASKLDPLRGVFRRTRSDGGISALTFIVTNHDQTMSLMTPWLDEAKEVGYNIIETWLPWSDLEPLPGVYQFQYLDPLVREAEKRGLHVVLRFTPGADLSPSWVPPEFQENQYHLGQGTWSGSSQRLWSLASSSLRPNYCKFLEATAAHFRNDPMVLGYTMDDIFCDHGMIDEPDLGQHMDYSAAMHQYYVKFLKNKYHNDLAKLLQAHHREYRNWQDVAIPSLEPEFDSKGRLIPCQAPDGLDFAACKRQVVETFRTEGNDAVRRGDPACIVGPYADTCADFDSRIYAQTKCFLPEGSMEEQFPVEPHDYVARCEPIAYIEGSIIADVGITNIAFHKFGWNEFNNYWFASNKIDSSPPLLKESELRLQKWFSVLDQLKGIQEQDNAKAAAKTPLVIGSLETLVYTWKTVFTSRMNDSTSPFFFQAGKEKVRAKFVFSADVTAESLQGCPYVYLPYASDTLDERLRSLLEKYVSNGGKLIMEWSSGYWEAGQKNGNILGGTFSLPDVSPLEADQASTAAEVNPQSILGKCGLSFRTREFKPPIEDQPVAWIHTIPRSYFRLCTIDGGLPANAVSVAGIDKKPVAYIAKHAQGEVLFFAGTVDWLSCPGLVTQLNAWGENQVGEIKPASDPELIISNYARGKECFALGRRFIDHTEISSILWQKMPADYKVKNSISIPMSVDPAQKYSVRELLSGAQLGQFDGTALKAGAVSIPLARGEGFVLQATPAP